jgi:hypothetical protein
LFDLSLTLTYGIILSLISLALILGSLYFMPRLWLKDLPKDLQALIPPKTEAEQRQSWYVGVPFLLLLVSMPFIATWVLNTSTSGGADFGALFLTAFGVAFTFNLVDWLIIDWLIVCTITPKFLVIPGTEGHPFYKDYGKHFRGFLTGTVLSAVLGLVIGGIVALF